MKPTSSLAGRAFLAILLTIGFYGLALAIAAALLYIPYAELQYAHRLHARLVLFCLVGAGVILWSIIPRRDRFEPPGPRLDPAKQPQLFAAVKDIAHKTQQSLPVEVYLVPEVNAFVAERGGFMGVGSKRVMGIGLPLLQALTAPQFQAVLAHEFGHYYGGDTKLGIWIYKIRAAIIRTVQNLGGHASWLQQPFIWYARLFLRITHSISRQQEFVADRLAAQTVSPMALIGGLRAVHGVAPAFQAFWQNEFAPVISSGYRPPLAEGFNQFIHTPSVTRLMDQIVDEAVDSGQTDPYDTHPSLRERIAALQSLPPGSTADDSTPALSLLDNVPQLEQEVFAHVFGAVQVRAWQVIDWSHVGSTVYLPLWQKTLSNYASTLQGLTPETLPTFLKSPTALARKLQESANQPLTQQQLQSAVQHVVGQALVVALAGRQWTLKVTPGVEITLQKEAITLEPFVLISDLASGKLSAEAWQQQCEQAGIAGLDLAAGAG
jgi:Zn-dependent protease with chaperone function